MAKSIYFKAPEKLTKNERGLLELSFTTLLKGEKLYGRNLEDMDHLLWVLQLLTFQMKNLATQNPKSKPKALFELSLDQNGIGIRLMQVKAIHVPYDPASDTGTQTSPSGEQPEVSPHQPELL